MAIWDEALGGVSGAVRRPAGAQEAATDVSDKGYMLLEIHSFDPA
ncbi:MULTISPECIES: hypothetical protein [Xanthobacter]|nr:hypothetical protein [Xanthobacter autotrophicus]